MIIPAPVSEILSRQFLGNSLQAWLTASLTAAILFAVLMVARWLLVSRLGALAARTTNQIDDMVVALIGETRAWVLLVLAVDVGVAPLKLPPRVEVYLAPAAKLVLLWQAAVWGAERSGSGSSTTSSIARRPATAPASQ